MLEIEPSTGPLRVEDPNDNTILPKDIKTLFGWSYLREFVSNFFDLLPLLANDCSVEPLLDDQVLGALVLLQETQELLSEPLSEQLTALWTWQKGSDPRRRRGLP